MGWKGEHIEFEVQDIQVKMPKRQVDIGIQSSGERLCSRQNVGTTTKQIELKAMGTSEGPWGMGDTKRP